MVLVKDIVNLMNNIANPGLAEDWDNPGLQIGSMEWKVESVILTLDVTEGVVKEAIKKNVNLIISHHPMIFKPLKKINDKKILLLLEHKIAVFSAHTNLDYIKGGVNSALAERLNLQNCRFIDNKTGSELLHISVIVPQSHMADIANAVFKAGAGTIGDYTECLTDYEVSGQFKPGNGSNPYQGDIGELEKMIERKLEFFVDSFNLNKVISAMKKAHPYETPAYSVYPQSKNNENFGLGLIGSLEEAITLEEMADYVKDKLKAPFVKLWIAGKSKTTKVKEVAICGGSGSSLLGKVIGKADVFVSADFTYHTILDSPIPIIDAGHFYTENPVLFNLKDMLKEFKVKIDMYSFDKHEIKNLSIR